MSFDFGIKSPNSNFAYLSAKSTLWTGCILRVNHCLAINIADVVPTLFLEMRHG